MSDAAKLEPGQVGIAVDGNPMFWPRMIRFAESVAEREPIKAYHVVVADTAYSYIGAERGGVRRRTVGTADDVYPSFVWSHFDLDSDELHAGLTFLTLQLGKPYSYLDDGVVGVDDLTPGTMPSFLYDHIINGRSWQCAALGDVYLRHAGIDAFPGRPAGAVDPGRFQRLYQDKGWL